MSLLRLCQPRRYKIRPRQKPGGDITVKLLGSLASPFVRKVRVTLVEKGIDCPLELENVWAANTTIQRANPLGQVPCLLLDDGSALYDSRVICEYLDSSAPARPLIPAAGPARMAVRRWEALGDGVLDAIVLVRLEVVQREPHERSERWVSRQMAKVDAGLAVAAKDLGKNAWCVSGSLTLADITLGSALGYILFRYPDINWRDRHGNLAALYDKLMQRPSFSTTIPE
jgi:glutathione S-transferase